MIFFLLFKIECCDFPSYWTFNIVSQHQVHPSRGSSLEELCLENNTGKNIVFRTVLIGRLRNCPNLDYNIILLSNAIWWQGRICPTLLVTNEDLPNMYQSKAIPSKFFVSRIRRVCFWLISKKKNLINIPDIMIVTSQEYSSERALLTCYW